MWYKLKRILIHPGWVEKQVRPSGWKPWSNTIAYFPFKDDTSDASGHWYTLDKSWSKQTIWYDFTSTVSIGNSFPYSTVKTSMCWCKLAQFARGWAHQAWFLRTQPWSYLVSDQSRLNWWFYAYVNGSNKYAAAPRTMNTRMHLVITVVWADLVCYKDWVQYTVTGWAWQGWYNRLLYLASNCSWTFCVSDAIFEDKVWTQGEITDYYNSTKANYWL